MKMGGYVPITRISSIIIRLILRVWAYSGFMLLFCFLLYYMYGGTLALLMFFFAITGILYQIQDNILFSPELPSHSRVFVPIPSSFGLPYESVNTRGFDGTLIHMYFIHQPKERQHHVPTIVFFHGNAGNMGHRLQNCVGLYYNLNCNILLVEYRGYGLSEGVPSEEGLYLDARTSIDYLYSRNDVNHEEIIVFGRSLGGAVALDLAIREEYKDKIWCIVVENTFTSIPAMAKVILGWRILYYFPLFFYKNKFLSYQKVKHLHTPILFVSGMADTLVPPKMMFELHEKCSSLRKQLLQIPGGTHNETWQLQGYYHALAVFLQNCRMAANAEFPLNSSQINNFKKKPLNDGTTSIWMQVQNI